MPGLRSSCRLRRPQGFHLHTVSSCFWVVSARSSGSFCELANFTIRICRNMCKNIVPPSWLFLWFVSWTFPRKQEDRLTLLGISPSYHQVFFPLGSTAGWSTTTSCNSGGFTKEAFFEKLQWLWNLVPLVSQCLDTWELILMTHLRTSGLRQETDGFSSPSYEQAEPKRQRRKMGCGEKDLVTTPNRIINSFHLSPVKEPFDKCRQYVGQCEYNSLKCSNVLLCVHDKSCLDPT